MIENARWNIRVFKLQGRQFEGVKVADARDYFEKFGGVQVYDAGFRLPYYGVEQDWLGVEFDHSHRRNKSSLLPERLHVKRALNDLPTQGRLFGVVAIDTGQEARLASERDQDAGEYLKIQVTRDRLVANRAYEILRDAVRWSLDYYATRERIREESILEVKRPEEPSTDKVGRVRDLVRQVRQSHKDDEVVAELEREIFDLAETIDDERKSDESARSLLGPLASAGMAALALEHESRKEMRIARGFTATLLAFRAVATISAFGRLKHHSRAKKLLAKTVTSPLSDIGSRHLRLAKITTIFTLNPVDPWGERMMKSSPLLGRRSSDCSLRTVGMVRSPPRSARRPWQTKT